jgi:hypothetical protein
MSRFCIKISPGIFQFCATSNPSAPHADSHQSANTSDIKELNLLLIIAAAAGMVVLLCLGLQWVLRPNRPVGPINRHTNQGEDLNISVESRRGHSYLEQPQAVRPK